RRLQTAAIGVLALAMLGGLLGWMKQDDLREQWFWFSSVRPHVLSAAAERTLARGRTFRECAVVCPEMVVLPAGEFMMVSADEDGESAPRHKVTFGAPFAVSKFEITFEEWDACVDHGGCSRRPFDGGWGHGRQPVINVSWNDAKQYAAWLSKLTGRRYRLLSE